MDRTSGLLFEAFSKHFQTSPPTGRQPVSVGAEPSWASTTFQDPHMRYVRAGCKKAVSSITCLWELYKYLIAAMRNGNTNPGVESSFQCKASSVR